MTKFREHRELLSDSMETEVPMQSHKQLTDYCQKKLSRYGLEIDESKVHVEPYAYDDRIGWDSHIVTIDGWGIFGFTDGPDDNKGEA